MLSFKPTFSLSSAPRDIRRDSREERGSLLPLERNACLPGCVWNATPEIPVAVGEEHWLLDTSLDEVYWPCSHSRAMPSFPSQLEWKIGRAWANTRGSLNSPS